MRCDAPSTAPSSSSACSNASACSRVYPSGASASVTTDGGRTWDRDHPARLVLSADLYVGWPVTIQLADQSLLTAYAITAYIEQPPQKTVTEVVRWKLP